MERDLGRNVRTSWAFILAPNILCVAGVFTLGFGIGMSVLTNNLAALAALANAVRPMRKVAAFAAERRHFLELELRGRGLVCGDDAPALDIEKYEAIAGIEDSEYYDRPNVGAVVVA